jgi:hypothetical protein
MTFKVKIGIKELGNDILKYMKFHIVETNETRRMRAGSLKTYILQDQLVRNKFGARCEIFSRYRDSSCGSAVPFQIWFQNDIFF